MRTPIYGVLLLAFTGCTASSAAAPQKRANVIVVMTDDQGYGDFGFAGNPHLDTPHLDAMASRSARLRQFYVSPVCTPTRAALMTGRHPQRTRAIDTWISRAMMDPDEITIAELLRDAGYATGIFGKWHLGDCYPMRAMDQGFEESLVHRGGGIGQPADPLGAEGKYTDPVLFHNGIETATKGYCTDVYFDTAIAWMRKQRAAGIPFFAYIPTNAPHGPFHDVPAKLLAKYEAMDLPKPDRNLARIFAMIENVDQNIGKLFAALRDLGATEDTLVVFLNDNGPNTRRFVRGLRGKKTEVHEGGIRSPLLAHWPGRLAPGTIAGAGVHYDMLPTILDACDVPRPESLRIDGRSLMPQLLRSDEVLQPRAIFLQSHRGDVPVRYHNFAMRRERWKLLNASGFGRELEKVTPEFELYDLDADPGEKNNLANAHADVVAQMRAEYDTWFDDVCSTRKDLGTPPRIRIGADAAKKVVLTRQDWKRVGKARGWGGRSMGEWFVYVERKGPYRITAYGLKNTKAERAELTLGDSVLTGDVVGRKCTWKVAELPIGAGEIRVTMRDAKGASGAYQVVIESR